MFHDINTTVRYRDCLIAMQEGRIKRRGSCEEMLTGKIIGELYDIDCDIIQTSRGKRVIF